MASGLDGDLGTVETRANNDPALPRQTHGFSTGRREHFSYPALHVSSCLRIRMKERLLWMGAVIMSAFSDKVLPLLIPGTPVVTEDEQNLGTVGSSRAGFIQVKGPWPFGFWLPVDAVDEVSESQVRLLIPRAWVDGCKVSPPAAA
jgi:hypothetical protein